MDLEKTCFICEAQLSHGEFVTVQARGIKTLISSSLQRKDNKHKLLDKKSSVQVHETCRTTYIGEKHIAAAVHALEKPSTSRSVRTESFDFKNCCLFCAQDASEKYIKKDNKKASSKRDPVRNITTLAFKTNVTDTAKSRGDEWGEEVMRRLVDVIDLVAAEGRYHHSCFSKFKLHVKSEKSAGRPMDLNVSKAIDFISTYLEKHREECQFSLRDIIKQCDGEIPCEFTIKQKLRDKYGDDIIITSNTKKEPIICYRDIGHKILAEAFYTRKSKDIEEERRKVVREAANIILEDIRSKVYETNTYPSPHAFLKDVESDVPESLQILLNTIILKHKKSNPIPWAAKITSIAHAIITATRPRSFLSALQVGLGTVLNRKYGSRVLLNLLSSLGVSATYEEAVLFETSAIMHPQTHIMSDSFLQFVFHNADHNVATIDGLNTFHAMGGIQCVTPSASVVTEGTFPRLKKIPAAYSLGKYGTTPLKTLGRDPRRSLSGITVGNLDELHPIEKEVKLSSTEFVWLYGKSTDTSRSLPGWHGFMENITSHLSYSTSRIIFLPFITASPSNYDTIYTALHHAFDQCIKQKQKVCFVTFDQPLYHKAREIVALNIFNSESCDIIIRLGGFHLLMSYLGAIGFIMDGSGLKELFSIAYASSSVDKMLSGHAYSRAIRAHLLVHLALAKIILVKTNLSENDEILLQGVLSADTILEDCESATVQLIVNKFMDTVAQLENVGSTSKLWIQYFKMVTIMKQFINAERIGNWPLHLDCVQRMLPFFHASGHLPYAKSGQLYLQDMFQLEQKLPAEEYAKFVTQGFFTIRRSDKFWAGIWSDMTIEQTLMKDSKSRGGLTHGRGTTDSVLAKWILGMPTIIEVTDKISEFCRIDFGTTEQHTDARPAKIERDSKDLQKFIDWFSIHPPFPETSEIMSLSTGVKGTEIINCHNANEVGMELMREAAGQNFAEIKLSRKARVKPLKNAHTSIKIQEETVSIDPLLLFQRISLTNKTPEELQTYLDYELSPYPLSLFNELGMRKNTKSSLYDSFEAINVDLSSSNFIHVVDGGYLLHRVLWQQKEIFDQITNKYVEYVQRHYQPQSFIVFDGYPIDATMKSTKYAERLRRQQKQTSPDTLFDLNMAATISQEKFLSNDNNKSRLIELLIGKLEYAGFQCKQAYEDADTLIVTTAMELSPNYNEVILVSEDIDVLVILTARSSADSNIYFLKPGRGKVEERLYSTQSFKYPSIRHFISFIHAFSGCDTTSALFGIGKMKVIQLLEKDVDLQKILGPFLSQDFHPDFLETAAEKLIIALYGAQTKDKYYLDEWRFLCFKKSVSKNSFNLASLPPTRAAARQHAYRVYHQVQSWGGVHLEPTEWGWKRTLNGLLPVTTEKEAAPAALLRVISCSCRVGCKGNCGCRRHGLKCSIICTNCEGQTCSNAKVVEIEIEEDGDEDIDMDLEKFLNVVISDEEGEESGEAEDFEGIGYIQETEESEIPMQLELRDQPQRKKRRINE